MGMEFLYIGDTEPLGAISITPPKSTNTRPPGHSSAILLSFSGIVIFSLIYIKEIVNSPVQP